MIDVIKIALLVMIACFAYDTLEYVKDMDEHVRDVQPIACKWSGHPGQLMEAVCQ